MQLMKYKSLLHLIMLDYRIESEKGHCEESDTLRHHRNKDSH